MKTIPKHNISIERATDLLTEGQPLSDAYVGGELKIETSENWDKEVVIENCTFDTYLDFQAGGHNKLGCQVKITNNDFKDFVNFFDCCYENEVTICNNRFDKGTNLFGKPNNIPVTFDVEPTIKDNAGRLDFDNEGERNENEK